MSPETLASPTQIIVLGRGIEPMSSDFPGTVQEDSPYSGESFRRALIAATYVQEHDAVKRVVFSGHSTFILPEHEVPERTEAEAMETVAQFHLRSFVPNANKPVISVIERWSRTTYGNFAESVRRGLLDPEQPTGIVVSPDQKKNALRAGRLVMPHAILTTIYPERDDHAVAPKRKDRISYALYRVAMLGVKPGDIETIMERDQLVQQSVLKVLSAKDRIVAHLRRIARSPL